MGEFAERTYVATVEVITPGWALSVHSTVVFRLAKFVVLSNKRGTGYASEVVFGPRLRRGLDHATASLRFAALARSNGQDRKEKDERKEPNDLQELCAFSTKVHKNCAKVVPKT